MAGRTVTRADLSEVVYQKVGLTRTEAADMVEQVLAEMCHSLAAGEDVKLSGFGVFRVRDKAERVGRNPTTGVEVPIEPRKAITFAPSGNIRAHVNGAQKKPRRARAKRGSSG